MKDSKIWLSSPHMGGKELDYIKNAFDSNWIAPLGPNLDLFEKAITNSLSSSKIFHAAALSSGTAALHLAFKILDLKKDDIVIVQSFTFCGTTNPISYEGAEIVFVDSEHDTWNMCPDALEQALNEYKNKNVKAIVPVHLYGMPANMDLIINISTKYNIPIIEDAAEALGSSYKGQPCGTFGLISALSFNGNKIITTSGGGALVSEFKKYIDKAKFLATQARDTAPHYEHSHIGYNYRMSNVIAGIGCGQIEVLDKRVEQRRANNKLYREFFKNIDGITFQTEPNKNYFSNYWLTTVFIDPKKTGGITNEKVRVKLNDMNIESRPLWKPMHMQPVYKNSKFYGTGFCENLFNFGLCLPSGSNLTENEFDRIFNTLSKIFKS